MSLPDIRCADDIKTFIDYVSRLRGGARKQIQPKIDQVANEIAYAGRVTALARQYRDLYDPEDEHCRFHDLLNEAAFPGDK